MVGKSKVLVGLQYGDEGKARVMDTMLDDIQIVARFNGGPNAGHTLSVGDTTIALHQVPSGIFYPNMQLYIGSGCVVNPTKILTEISDIESKGLSVETRLHISPAASLILPQHIEVDKVYGKEIGSTGNGIGPAYADQALRTRGNVLANITVGGYLSDVLKGKNDVRLGLERCSEEFDLRLDIASMVNSIDRDIKELSRYVEPNVSFVNRRVHDGDNVFYEGAQSIMLDCVTGLVPCVTSSRTLAAAAYTGGDLSNKYHHKTIGVAKAIMSRVGAGPFVSEFGSRRSEDYCAEDGGKAHSKEYELSTFAPRDLLRSDDLFDIGVALRILTNEYGATTRRPRRIGALDLVMLKQNCELNGVDELYINKFDCLLEFNRTRLKGIPLVTGYDLNGKILDDMPNSVSETYATKPVFDYAPFISEDISRIRDYKDLPGSVIELIKYIENYVGTRVAGIGVGPEREQFVKIPQR